jgi:hypothetical protein
MWSYTVKPVYVVPAYVAPQVTTGWRCVTYDKDPLTTTHMAIHQIVGVNQWILLREGVTKATIDTVRIANGGEAWRIECLPGEGMSIQVLLDETEGFDPDLDEPQPAMAWAEDRLCRIDPPSRDRLAAIIKALGYANDPSGTEAPWLLVDAFSANFRDALAFAFKPTEATTLRGCYDAESVFVVPNLPDSAAGHEAALMAIEKAVGVAS